MGLMMDDGTEWPVARSGYPARRSAHVFPLLHLCLAQEPSNYIAAVSLEGPSEDGVRACACEQGACMICVFLPMRVHTGGVRQAVCHCLLAQDTHKDGWLTAVDLITP